MKLLFNVMLSCVALSSSQPPFVPTELKNDFRQGYRKPSVVSSLESGRSHFASEVREHGTKKFFLFELAGVSDVSHEKVWGVLKDPDRFDTFIPFVEVVEPRSKYADGTQAFYVSVGVWGYGAAMDVRVRTCEKPKGEKDKGLNRLVFTVDRGSFMGMEGELRLEAFDSANKKVLIVMEGHWLTENLGIPWIIMKFGMEFALQKMAAAFLKEVRKA